jgi:hypothetical protein
VPRNPSANLSPTELASLRRVYSGLINTVPTAHRELFITMKLAAVDDKRGLVVTEIGEQRLRSEGRVPWRGTPASNLLGLPPRADSKKPSKLVRDIVGAVHDMTKHQHIVWWVRVHDVYHARPRTALSGNGPTRAPSGSGLTETPSHLSAK